MMSMIYQAYQNHMDLTEPWRSGAANALKYLNLVPQGTSDRMFGRLAAALEKVPGVENAKVDFKSKRAIVAFDPAKTSPEALARATADAGFPSSVNQGQ